MSHMFDTWSTYNGSTTLFVDMQCTVCKKSKYRKEEEIQNKLLHKMTFFTLVDANTPYTCVMTYDLMKYDRQEQWIEVH